MLYRNTFILIMSFLILSFASNALAESTGIISKAFSKIFESTPRVGDEIPTSQIRVWLNEGYAWCYDPKANSCIQIELPESVGNDVAIIQKLYLNVLGTEKLLLKEKYNLKNNAICVTEDRSLYSSATSYQLKNRNAWITEDEKPFPYSMQKKWREALIDENSIYFGEEICYRHFIASISNGKIIEFYQKAYINGKEQKSWGSRVQLLTTIPYNLKLRPE